MPLCATPLAVRDLGIPVKGVSWTRLHPGKTADGRASLLISMGQNNGGLFVLDVDLATGRCRQFAAADGVRFDLSHRRLPLAPHRHPLSRLGVGRPPAPLRCQPSRARHRGSRPGGRGRHLRPRHHRDSRRRHLDRLLPRRAPDANSIRPRASSPATAARTTDEYLYPLGRRRRFARGIIKFVRPHLAGHRSRHRRPPRSRPGRHRSVRQVAVPEILQRHRPPALPRLARRANSASTA
jgi:hypothetical protein